MSHHGLRRPAKKKVYATLNPDQKSGSITLSNGNLTASASISTWVSVLSTIFKSSGKWYFEVTVDVVNNSFVGISGNNPLAINNYCGRYADGWGWFTNAGLTYHDIVSKPAGATSTSDGDVIMCAFDADNDKVWWGLNGVWNNGSVPAAGTGAQYTNVSGGVSPMLSFKTGLQTCNFGSSPFIYSVPAGFNGGIHE